MPEVEVELAGRLLDACRQPVAWSEYRDDWAEQLAHVLSGAATTSTQGTLNPGSRNYPTLIIQVAGGMQATADWLREADLDTMRAGVERQVKEHPGRTLLIAVGLGYLLGKAFRK